MTTQFADADLVVAADGVNSATRRRHGAVFEPDIDTRECRYHLARHDEAVPGVHVRLRGNGARLVPDPRLPVQHDALDRHRRDARGDLARARPRRGEPRAVDRLLREAVREVPRRPPAHEQCRAPARLRLAQLPARALQALAPRQPRADRRRRPHRALLASGRARSSRWRTRSRSSRARPAASDVPAALARLPGRARDRGVASLQSAARNRMRWFEDVARYTRLEPWQFTYSLLTGSQRIGHDNLKLRDPAFVADVEARLATRVGRRRAAAADVPAIRDSRHAARESRRRLADGAVLGRRRHARRLAPRAPRRARDGRGRAGLHRDDLRVARRAHLAGLHRALERGAARRVAADRRVRARAQPREALHAARALRSQGLDPARLGGRGPARCRPATGRRSRRRRCHTSRASAQRRAR